LPVAISALFTRQHYVLDVIAGMLLAWLAYVVFLRGCRREHVPESDRQAAPVMAVAAAAIVGLMTACFWVAYLLNLS
jgi:membrane-associated phospholipid phosphatase